MGGSEDSVRKIQKNKARLWKSCGSYNEEIQPLKDGYELIYIHFIFKPGEKETEMGEYINISSSVESV